MQHEHVFTARGNICHITIYVCTLYGAKRSLSSTSREKTVRYIWYFSRFRSLLILILLGAFLAFSSLGAGLGKRKNRLVHIRRTFRSQMKENTAVAIYNQITFPVLEI
jgi:hypothetical protein